mgnify:CR=1 FL=1
MAKPTLALIPSAQGSKFYSVLPSNGVGDFDFTRSGSATRINAQGLIETVSDGVSRLNYPLIDGVVNGCPSHLLEPSRTNLVTYNNDLTNANWTTGNISKVANDTISPNGTLDASKVIATVNNNSHYFQQQFNIGENNVTISAYVKNIDANYIQVTNAGNALAFTNFDIQNGTVGTSGSAMSNQKIEKLPNDWYRISVTVDNTGVAITYMRFYMVSSASAVFNEFWLPTSAVSLNVWGVQCELGEFETSVIPTTTASVTRSAETANDSGDAATFNSLEGVLYIETSALSNDLSERRFGLSDGTSSNVVRVGYTSVSNRIIAVVYNGSDQAVMTYTSSDITQNSKIAVKYKENDFALWVDGVERSTDTSGSVFSANTLNSLDFNIGGSSHFYSKTKDVRVYNTALTDAELTTLTTI